VLTALHVVLAHGVARNRVFSTVLEGNPIELGNGGSVDQERRRQHMISDGDLMEALRKKGVEDVRETKRIVLEASGEITVIKPDA
jgi:uncharacterized membrane protein YcaP (DUF421 family)